MIMNKRARLQFEIAVADMFDALGVNTKDKLYELQEEMEDCIETAIYDYCEDNNL